jgi:MOSC domain-containing protein YiiM
MKQTLGRDEEGNIIRKAGVMSIVLAGGVVKPGDSIRIEAPAAHVPLAPV